MRIKIFFLLCLIFFTGILKAKNCFFPANFNMITNEIYMPCVVIAGDSCYATTFEVKSINQQIIIILKNVENNDNITFQDIEHKEFIPYYNSDNETLTIPAITINSSYYNVDFKLTFIGDKIGFYLLNVLPILTPSALPICLSDENTDENTKEKIPFQEVFSQKVLYNNELVECFEYKGSSDFITYISSIPVPVPEGLFEIKTAKEICPSGFERGCYKIDEDNNWYAQYKYSSKIADYIFPLVCPSENGYHEIYP